MRPHGAVDEPATRLGAALAEARTLPGAWYADAGHHERELAAVFARRWVSVACDDDVRRPGSFLVASAARVPVLVVRDAEGRLRAFLNMCRHRGAPLAEGCGTTRALVCPYHAWVYRLDGSLARAGGVGRPAGFDPATSGLVEVSVTTFARSVLVNLDPDAEPFDGGPLTAALDPYRLGELELVERARYECAFNWKVLLENYCENYHTPFVHSQLPVNGYEYPIECAGPVVFAWDRPLVPRDASEQALHDHRPGEPGWAAVADVAAAEPFNNGAYFAMFPNTAMSCFSGFAATFRLLPTSASTTVVEREYLWHPMVAPERRAADLAATREVVEQDLRMCETLQHTYDAGLSANGVLSTVHESGVAHVHQLLLEALTGSGEGVSVRSRP